MGLLRGLLKTVVNTATLPLAAVGDLIDTATDNADVFGRSKSGKKVRKIGDGLKEAFDGDLL